MNIIVKVKLRYVVNSELTSSTARSLRDFCLQLKNIYQLSGDIECRLKVSSIYLVRNDRVLYSVPAQQANTTNDLNILGQIF